MLSGAGPGKKAVFLPYFVPFRTPKRGSEGPILQKYDDAATTSIVYQVGKVLINLTIVLLTAGLVLTSTPAVASDPLPFSNEKYIDYTPGARRLADDKIKDVYEPNDTRDSAVCLTPNDYLSGVSYTTTATGFLERSKENYGDDDFYYIKNMSDAWISVTVESKKALFLSVGEYQYDVIQMNDAASPTMECDLSHILANIYETEEDEPGILQTTKFFAHSGTYFVGISYLTNDKKRDENEYKLAVRIEYSQTDYSDINLEDAMFNRDLAGALWVMDSPLNGNFDILKKPASITYHQKAYPRLAGPEYYLDDLHSDVKNQPIKFATYYLWDESLLAALRQVATDAFNLLDSMEQGIKLKNQELTTNFDIAEKTLTVTAKFVAASGKIFKFISVITGIASSLLNSVASILKAILPTLLTPTDTVRTFKAVMRRLMDVFNKNIDQAGYRVIQIPLYFNFKEAKDKLVSKTRLMVDTTVTAEILANYDDFLLNDHQLSPIDVVNYDRFRRGKFYGYKYSLSSEDGLKYALLDSYPTIPHTPEPLTINLSSGVSALRGDYSLFSFAAPKEGSYYVILRYQNDEERLDLSVFASRPVGYSNDGMVQTKCENVLDVSHYIVGTQANLTMKEGEKLYFRVKKEEYARFDSATIVVQDRPSGPHEATYQWKTNKQHWKNCSCGNKKLEGHAVSSSDLKTCVLCHGSVSTGFVGPSRSASANRKFGNGSYVRPDGVYVLSNADLPLLLEGSLRLPEA